MARNYTVQTKIKRPVADVFDAVISKEKMLKYFVDGASDDLVEGNKIRWHWNHYGENPIEVKTVVENQLIILTLDSREWDKTKEEAYDVDVIFEFEALNDDSTLLSISEEGWKTDTDGLKGSYENCGGWTHMTMCLKAWIEHDIDLRWE